MAKKFGKTLLLSAAVISAAAAVYFYLQKKDAAEKDSDEEDYDDFGKDLNESADGSRSYVPLNPESSTQQAENSQDTMEVSSTEASSMEASSTEASSTKAASTEACSAETSSGESSSAEPSQPSQPSVEEFPINSSKAENTFTPLTEQAAEAAANSVEEFFDEEDGPGIEPPINDN